MQNAQYARLEAWTQGHLTDEDLSMSDIRALEVRLFDAAVAKNLKRDDVFSFVEHSTLQ